MFQKNKNSNENAKNNQNIHSFTSESPPHYTV